MNPLEILVLEEVLQLVRRRLPDLQRVTFEQELIRDLDFDSLEFAELATALETRLNPRIFRNVAFNGILTVAELCQLCASRASPESKRE